MVTVGNHRNKLPRSNEVRSGEAKRSRESSEEPDQREKKEDANNNIRSIHVDKNDVEKDLDDIDKSEKLQDSELMDADMRLQRAVVEKDMGNEYFKVKSSSPKCL